MSALVHHARFLRPLSSVLFATAYTTMAFSLSQTFLRFDSGAAQLSALLVALPLLVGVFLAGAALEPLHRPFALLLPGIRSRQLRFAVLSTALAALVITTISIWAAPAVSPVSSFGLIAALLALPHLNSSQFRSLLASPMTEFATWLTVSLAFGIGLTKALNHTPWFCLATGLAIAALSLRRSYSRSILRTRARTPFVAFQTQFYFRLFSPTVSERWQTEHSEQTKHGSARPGQDWPARTLWPTLRDWLPVLWYLQLGARNNESRFRLVPTMFVVGGIGGFVLFPSVGLFSGQPDYWTALASSIHDKVAFQLQLLAATGLILRVTPWTTTFPVSRAFLGRMSFWHAVKAWLSVVLFSFALVALPSLIGQLVSGHPLPGYGLPALINRTLLFAALLPLVIAANQNPARQLLVFCASIFIAILAASFAHRFLTGYSLEAIGLTLLLGAIAGSLALLRHHLLRHYATCDLPLSTRTTVLAAL